VSKVLGKCLQIRLRRRFEDKMNLTVVGCENGRRMELAENHVHWYDLVLEVLNLWAVLP
jgi:hypothetical protein